MEDRFAPHFGSAWLRPGQTSSCRFTSITEVARKGNGRKFGARHSYPLQPRLGLVKRSSSSTESCQNDSLPKPSTKRKWNGRELARHRCLETGGTCSPLWCDIGQAGTSLVIWIYPHNGRGTEGRQVHVTKIVVQARFSLSILPA